MTLPLPKKNIFGSPATRRNWLDRYLGVERLADQQVYNALKQATKDIDASLAKVAKKQGKTAKVRRLQLALAHKEIRAVMADLYGDKITKAIRSGHSNAAAAAVEAAMRDEKALLKKIFPLGKDAEDYAKSLRLTARRDIDATMTRVLQSNIPLSQRVWSTRALSQGMVDRAVNAALARGDSYEQLAKAVHHLVDPETPGGVTYAAKRLARTEINNAYHAQSIRDAQEKPWITHMRWHLSKRHMNDPGDPCEAYSLQGLFPIEQVPHKPHPHCRCFVTPEPVDDATFDRMLDGGQMDRYLDDFIGGNVDPVDMDPSPFEKPTTKAAQPDGWTGPLVAKAAANKDVRRMTDELFLGGSTHNKFMQAAREGSRIVQVKGYKGGLSSPGKQAILAQDGVDAPEINSAMALDLGREITARIAYAEPSAAPVYKAIQMRAVELRELARTDAERPNVSLPLSTFEKNINEAFRLQDSTSDKDVTVVWEVTKGAKVSEVGDSRATMGSFEVESVTEKSAPTGGKYHVVRLRQTDAREFEANTPKGETIQDFEFYTDTGVSKPVAKPASKPVVAKKTFREKIDEAQDVPSVRKLLEDKFPATTFHLYEGDIDLASMKEVAQAVDEQMVKHPIIEQSLEVVEIWEEDKMGSGLAHVQPTIRYTNDGVPVTMMRINAKYARDHSMNKIAMRSMEANKWLVPTATDVKERPMAKTITHEFGHVLDWATTMFENGKDDRPGLGEYLLRNWFLKAEPQFKGKPVSRQRAGMVDRLSHGAGPSNYAVTKPNKYGFHYAELIAESFADVEVNGYDKAKPVSQAAYDWLMEQEASPSAIW